MFDPPSAETHALAHPRRLVDHPTPVDITGGTLDGDENPPPW